MKKIVMNERIYLREMTVKDTKQVAAILKDPETMYAFENPYSDEDVTKWIEENIKSYAQHGFGIWAVINQKNGKFIGQCGIVYSEVTGQLLLEVGYLINKKFWNQGYANEASALCIQYAKDVLHAERICSIVRGTNIPSIKVAEHNKMKIIKEFDKNYSGTPVKHYVYSLDLK